ncbi:hypothetical protein [Streptococcus intermedius]|nr:hypothetical protein [Streptococcus intermedius]QKH77066.1 hypothetical protein FOC71_00345 [Streptococcus intermedius]
MKREMIFDIQDIAKKLNVNLSEDELTYQIFRLRVRINELEEIIKGKRDY